MTDSLSAEQTFLLFESFVSEEGGRASDDEIRAYLRSFSERLPTREELSGAARCLRKHMRTVDTSALPADAQLVDTCGTGGSGLDTFNTSTLVAFVCAGAGLYVPKHGNRAASSQCGSADLLEALGVKLDLTPAQCASCLAETRFAFLFAPLFHPATKRVQGIRRELKIRTIFNFLGPLLNPAGVKRQLLGVSSAAMRRPMAEALRDLGSEHVLVVCGEDGIDELSICAASAVTKLRGGEITEYVVRPEDAALMRAKPEDVKGAPAAESARFASALLAGENGPRADLIVLNAGAALYAAGAAESIVDGAALARDVLQSGAAKERLDAVVECTGGMR